MKYLMPDVQGITEASMLDPHLLIIIGAVSVVVGIGVVTLSVLSRGRREAHTAGRGMSPGRIAFKIIMLALAAASIAFVLLKGDARIDRAIAFITGRPCCSQEDAQVCCPEAEAEEKTQSQSEATSTGFKETQAGLAGEAEKQ